MGFFSGFSCACNHYSDVLWHEAANRQLPNEGPLGHFQVLVSIQNFLIIATTSLAHTVRDSIDLHIKNKNAKMLLETQKLSLLTTSTYGLRNNVCPQNEMHLK